MDPEWRDCFAGNKVRIRFRFVEHFSREKIHLKFTLRILGATEHAFFSSWISS